MLNIFREQLVVLSVSNACFSYCFSYFSHSYGRMYTDEPFREERLTVVHCWRGIFCRGVMRLSRSLRQLVTVRL